MSGSNDQELVSPDQETLNAHGDTLNSCREILNIEQAAELLGVSVKTFNKVLHSEDMPARKIGREWKFSRRALIEWVGSGHSKDFYREGGEPLLADEQGSDSHEKSRRTEGWHIQLD